MSRAWTSAWFLAGSMLSYNSNYKMNEYDRLHGHLLYVVFSLFSLPNQDNANPNVQKSQREVRVPWDIRPVPKTVGSKDFLFLPV